MSFLVKADDAAVELGWEDVTEVAAVSFGACSFLASLRARMTNCTAFLNGLKRFCGLPGTHRVSGALLNLTAETGTRRVCKWNPPSFHSL